jgi:hypothetical protein
MTQSAGRCIALAAILVQAPRLILALLAADRQPVSPEWQRGLVVVAGLGTALVLTGGNLYLAHTLVIAERWRSYLVLVRMIVLGSSGCLLVSMIAGGLSGRTLHEVLSSAELQWSWAVLAAVAHEVTAAGCMLASASLVAGSGQLSELSPLAQPGELAGSGLAASLAGPQPTALPIPCRAGASPPYPRAILRQLPAAAAPDHE